MIPLSGADRTRDWACVVYPDSAPKDWVNILEDFHVPAFISPLHSVDVDNGTGELKKAHYHVLLMFEGPKTYRQFDRIRFAIGGVGREYVQSKRGYARYLCHLDNPEKAQYPPDYVISLSGADYMETIGDGYNRHTVIMEMCKYCRHHKVRTFSQLMDFALANEPDWARCLMKDSTLIMTKYIEGLRKEKL